jgi:hypothetical protein
LPRKNIGFHWIWTGILKSGELDAYFYTTNAIVAGQAYLIVNKANAMKLATMFHEQTIVANGALASYGSISTKWAAYQQGTFDGYWPAQSRRTCRSRITMGFHWQSI